MRRKMDKVADDILENEETGVGFLDQDEYLKVKHLRSALSQCDDDDIVVIENMYGAESYAGWEAWPRELSENYKSDFRTKALVISFNPNIELPIEALE